MNIAERFVCHIWDSKHYHEETLSTQTGKKLEILFPGNWNTFAGPDFKNARINFDNEEQLRGDIEIHLHPRSWYNHNHHKDENYNSVILHVVMWADDIPITYNSDEEKIEILELFDMLDESIEKLFEEYETDNRSVSTQKCTSLPPLTEIGQRLDTCGALRFKEKAANFKAKAEDSRYEQLLYAGIMEALGYSKNRAPMKKLVKQLSVENIKRLTANKNAKESVLVIQALLFGVAGLLPSQNPSLFNKSETLSSPYIEELENIWELLSGNFSTMNKSDWQFFRVRPSNFPTKRLAAAAHLFAKNIKKGLLESFIRFFYDAKDETFENLFRKLITDDYWTTHYNFRGKRHERQQHLIGTTRAKILSINIILPVLYSFFNDSANPRAAEEILNSYSTYKPIADNHITRLLKKRIFGTDTEKMAALDTEKKHQGLIYIFKEFCSKGNCNQCILTKKHI